MLNTKREGSFLRVTMELIAPFVFSAGACAQQVLWQRDADEQNMPYGEALAPVPDRNGDGIDDLLLSYSGKNCNSWSGMVYLLSGVDGSEIWSICGGGGDVDGGSDFGCSIAVLPDFDQDGVPEFAVGASVYDNYLTGDTWAGAVFVYSGATQTLIHELLGESLDIRFGSEVRRIADVDADGFDDLLVSAPRYKYDYPNAAGRVYIYSSQSWALLRTHDGEKDLDYFGGPVGRVRDLDQDGTDEYTVASSLTKTTDHGQVEFFSGSTGTLLYRWNGDHYSGFGQTIVDAGDLNGDGVTDLLITDPGVPTESGYVHAYSGADESELFTIRGTSNDDKFGVSCTMVGDLNEDGVGEFLVGAYVDDQFGTDAGSATLYSGRTARALYTFSPGYDHGTFGSNVCGGSDFNGDGIPDMLIKAGQAPLIRGKRMGGRVTAFAGNDLYLQALESVVQPNDTVTLETRGGESGALTLLVLVDISGTQLFAPLSLTTFDANSESSLTATVTSAESGLDFTLIAYAQKHAGGKGIIDSWTEVVSVE